jgi:hypothetical protein
MFDTLKFLVVVAFAVFIYPSVPASAGAKTDCENGIKQAEKDFGNAALDKAATSTVQRLLDEARAAQKEGKNKSCVKKVSSAKSKM